MELGCGRLFILNEGLLERIATETNIPAGFVELKGRKFISDSQPVLKPNGNVYFMPKGY